MTHFILASGSPRRRDILTDMGIKFDIKIPSGETSILNKSFSYELVENTAREKGFSVLDGLNEPSTVISADTVVVYNNIILGKPKGFDDAFHMLKLLNGNTHKVVTAVCVISSVSQKYTVKSCTSEVTFNKTGDEAIKDYIFKFKPYDKAGSYGIQELEPSFIKDIKGEYDNIVGLPSKMLKEIISELT